MPRQTACEDAQKNWAMEIQEGCGGAGTCAVASGTCTGTPAASTCAVSNMESATDCPAGCVYAGKDACENTGNTWVEGSAAYCLDAGLTGATSDTTQETCEYVLTGSYLNEVRLARSLIDTLRCIARAFGCLSFGLCAGHLRRGAA